jgi:hypothetical protein
LISTSRSFLGLRKQENTEYISFKEKRRFFFQGKSYDGQSNQLSQLPLAGFCPSLIDDVVPKCLCPIMPEVKLSSWALGIAGTIDLVVLFDGEGRTISLITKQKS